LTHTALCGAEAGENLKMEQRERPWKGIPSVEL
jgi:hypothetical protein